MTADSLFDARDAFVADRDFVLHVGDVRDTLKLLPDRSVDCCVTSPPYWGLRDYGTARWSGGVEDCNHVDPGASRTQNLDKLGERYAGGGHKASSEGAVVLTYRGVCGKCGAQRDDSQIGLESSPEEYVAAIVDVFREVRRILVDGGTLWLNLGDSYNVRGPKGQNGHDKSTLTGGGPGYERDVSRSSPRVPVLKPKDLVGIPWRVAFALQADGWWLRSDIIWSKPNPMPESVTDRPTKAHEYVFLLSKSPRYFFDADAIREAAVGPDRVPGMTRGVGGPHAEQAGLDRRARRTALIPKQTTAGIGTQGIGSETFGHYTQDGGRNVRSVWEIATQPYAQAHFAVFPEALPERCIKAGCPEGGTVLDPFMGSGTTALVARRLGRRSVGVELNPDYAALCAARLSQLSLLAEPAA